MMSYANSPMLWKHIPQDGGAEVSSEHKPLSPADQEINRHIEFRLAGHDMAGNFLGKKQMRKELRLLHDIESKTLVVKPDEIRDQIARFSAALKEAGGDYLKVDPSQFKFMSTGGHVSKVPLARFNELAHENGYAIWAEYAKDDVRVPLGYNYGLTSAPLDDKRFPNLDVRDIAGGGDDIVKMHDDIWYIWRASVFDLDNDVVQILEDAGTPVPDSLKGISGKRRGINNAFKPVIVEAAHQMHKKHIAYNTAMLQRPGELLDAAGLMPNLPIRSANKEIFLPMKWARRHVDKIKDVDGEAIALVRWDVFANSLQSILTAEADPKGVLSRKGGWNIEKLRSMGAVVAGVLQNRAQVKNALKKRPDKE